MERDEGVFGVILPAFPFSCFAWDFMGADSAEWGEVEGKGEERERVENVSKGRGGGGRKSG